ncbi:MAG: pyridoxamine 5'-phosphate oxidase [Balneolaceae bacterium]|nr:MAG: pyridoxamine 5'-phosphate oxidase [Balneolaceae bacterium]
MAVAAIRREYTGEPLTEEQTNPDPFVQFENWFGEAVRLSTFDPSAMFLATATANEADTDTSGRIMVSGRVVLLKGFDERGFVFYTHYESRKGMQLNDNPRASLTFYWPEMVRQVCIEGIAARIPAGESDAYFDSRPAGSRISAIASPQSRTVQGRSELEARTEKVRKSGNLTRPENWGGYRLCPDRIEFWQGRPNRLHDRILFTREMEHSPWKMERLAP